MGKSVIFTNGVIAVRENKLLRDKIMRLTEISAEDAFRSVTESGFGKGAEAENVYDYEKLLVADERELDAFIAEYAPSNAEKAYFLAPRDFHNAKAILKAQYLNEPVDGMLAPDGEITAEELAATIKSGKLENLNGHLREATESCNKLFAESDGSVSGAEIGAVFDRALYGYLFSACSKNGFLKKALTAKADMSNILTAMRAESFDIAQRNFIDGGKLKVEVLQNIFSENAERALDGTAYKEFYALCTAAKQQGKPLTDAERVFDGYETSLLKKYRFELKNSQPFIYYVLRRRAENADLRIIFVCLLAGMSGRDIVKRLRSV